MNLSVDASEADPPGIAPERVISLVPQSLGIKPTICLLDTLGTNFLGRGIFEADAAWGGSICGA